MKIRTGFVSNSSSSSFCILGVDIGDEFDYDTLEQWEEEGLDFHKGYEDYAMVVGVYPNSLEDQFTIRQCKEHVAELITRVTGVTTTADEVKFCYDGGYDG